MAINGVLLQKGDKSVLVVIPKLIERMHSATLDKDLNLTVSIALVDRIRMEEIYLTPEAHLKLTEALHCGATATLAEISPEGEFLSEAKIQFNQGG